MNMNKEYLMKDMKLDGERTGAISMVDAITPIDIAEAFNDAFGLSGTVREIDANHIHFEGDTIVAVKPNIQPCSPHDTKLPASYTFSAKLYELQRLYVTEVRTIEISKLVEGE